MSRSARWLVLMLCGARVAAADGTGAVEGRIRYVGARAAAPASVVPASFPLCGRSQPPADLLVGKDRALANVVVSIPGVPGAHAAPPSDVVIDQKMCRYTPHVAAAPVGSRLTLTNSDDLLHNVHARAGDVTLFNLAMPIRGQRLTAPASALARPGVVALRCDAGHTWMSAFVHVFDHPFFAVTGADGAFRIDGLPPGEWPVLLDHETLGTSAGKVTITAGATTRLDVDWP